MNAICGEAGNLIVLRDLAGQIGQDRRIADMAHRDPERPDLGQTRVGDLAFSEVLS